MSVVEAGFWLGAGVGAGASPHPVSVIPFVGLLLMIALGPLFFRHFWERYYPVIAILMGIPVIVYYLAVLGDIRHPIHTMFEYFSFITLVGSLFIASSGIFFRLEGMATPGINVAILLIGAIISNIIGTTGASILLIRPFLRLNRHRIGVFHVVFFIFVVSNMGGSLTPIGDPPLFLGFLKGVPFFWTLTHLIPLWMAGVGMVLLVFYLYDRWHFHRWLQTEEGQQWKQTGKKGNGAIRVKVVGLRSVLWLAIIIGGVFLDPALIPELPAIEIHGERFSFIREVLFLIVAVLAYKTASREALKGNDFNFEPIREVGFLFLGIFATMIPALQLIAEFAGSPEGLKIVNIHTLYWGTGVLSSFLDNAPTYLNFLSAAMGKYGLDISYKEQVRQFVEQYPVELMAVSISAVFFGAMTYIGNAPNFMVRNIAEQAGIDMPTFGGYIFRYSLVYLLPVLFVIYLVFFVFLYG